MRRTRTGRRRLSATATLLCALMLSAVAFGSCSRPVEIVVSVEESAEGRWRTLLDAYPPPEAFDLVEPDDAATDARPAIRLARRLAPAIESTPTRRVLERRWLAPAAPLWQETPASRAVASPAGDPGELVPLVDIGLPLTARPAGGLYPDHPDYPLVDGLIVELDLQALGLEPDDERRVALSAWFASLPVSEARAPEVVWIGGVGDLMVARGVTRLLDRPDGLDVVFSDVLPLMREVDFLLGNLEGAVTVRGEPLSKGFTFRFHPRVLDPLARAGFDYVSVVNNHSYDYGEIGFLDTLAWLEQSPIGTSGVGRDLEEAGRAYRTMVAGDGPATDAPGGVEADAGAAPDRTAAAGLPVAVLSAGAYPVERSGFDGARTTAAAADRPGVLWADPRNPTAQEAALEAMRREFGRESFDIVMVHGGAEWATAPSQAQRELYRSYVDAGADLVLGHHSHVVQGFESYRGALIAYSLGNFVFPGMFVTEFGEESVLLRVGIVDGAIRYVEPVPVRIDHQLLSLDPDGRQLPRMLEGTRALHGE
ncbi:MAG: CapA family protein [bacterium]